MRRGIFRLFLLSMILFVAGCTFEPVRQDNAGSNAQMCRTDLDAGVIRASTRDGGTETSVITRYEDFRIDMPSRVRMNYNPLTGVFKNIGVTGRFPSGRNYFVRIDSGFPWYVGLTDTVVSDQKLASCFISESPIPMGVCDLKSLSLGEITVVSPPCLHFQQHWELQMLKMPVWKERAVLIGINLMERFSYILFDNRKGQVEFGRPDTPFMPADDRWQTYPLSLVDDPQGQRRLHVDLSLAGEDIPAWLDTGNPGQLEMSSRVWEKMASHIEGDEPRKSVVQYWQFGTVECEKIQVHRLMLGNLERKNVEVVVLPDGKPFYETYALIGMGFFKKDVIVLDFYRHLFWIKQR